MISVVIPIQGRVELLEPCLQSLRAQKNIEPVEIIIVSDHNSPSADEQIKSLAQKFGASYLKNSGLPGAPAARNFGAAAVQGQYLFFCDADVVLEVDALAQLLNALEKNLASAFAYGDFYFGGRLMRGQPFSATELQKNNFISTMTLLPRSKFFGFDEQLTRFQDWDLWLTLSERGESGKYVPAVIFRVLAQGGISHFIPSFVAKNARWFLWWPRVKKYYLARQKILAKHHLVAK